MRYYLTLLSDHGGGSVSTHSATLVASSLSDPYLSLDAAVNAIAGPLGSSSQMAVTWMLDLKR